MDIRLIASDLDGTLLDDRKNISERTWKAIDSAVKKGILFVPVTGRIPDALPEKLRTPPIGRYAITVNGAGVWDLAENKVIHRAEIPKERAIAIAHFMRRYGTMYDCYAGGRGYMEEYYYDQIGTYCLEAYRPMIRETRTPVKDLIEFLESGGDVQKMQMFFIDLDLRIRAMRELQEEFPDTAVTSSISNNIEVNIKEANKGQALQVLCGHLGIDMENVLAFGDGGNDVTLLRAAGTGVAMANGCREAKEAAGQVTESNEDDGVAVFLEKYVL